MTALTRCSGAALALLLPVLAACADTSSAPADVQATLEAFYGAMKSGDTVTAMAQIAPDAIFVESGRLETREEYEKNHLPADIAFEKQVSGKRGDWRTTINGDTAWAIATTEFVGTFDTVPVDFVSTQLAVLTRADTRWLIRSIHWSSMRR